MKYRQLKFVDFYGVHSFHEMISVCLLKMFASEFRKIEVVSGNSFGFNLRRNFETLNVSSETKVSFKLRWVVEREDKLGAFLRIICGFFFTFYEYLVLSKEDVLFLNYSNPLSLPLILKLNSFLKRKIVIVMHGELEYVFVESNSFALRYLYGRLNRFSLCHLLNSSNAQLLVLGESIKKNLLAKLPNIIPQRIIAIEHPYIFKRPNSCASKDSGERSGKLVVGVAGLLNMYKGLLDLCKLSQILDSEIANGKIELRQIGKVESSISLDDYPNVKWCNSVLNRHEYDRRISELDYLLFLYPLDSYKYTASGAVFDAITFEKPIIALDNSYFHSILSKFDIGYLCHDLFEISEILKDLSTSASRKGQYGKSFTMLKKVYDIDAVSQTFFNQFHSIN